jgi:putative ABC transport system permease protein
MAAMRPRDILLIGLFSLRRQKLRTTLTTLGVTIGIATLVASVSVGVGVRRIIEDGFKKEHRLREIIVYPGLDRGSDEFTGIPEAELRVEGAMADARRERIRKRLARDYRRQHTAPAPKPLTPARIRAFAEWDHVISVVPDLRESARLMFHGQVLLGDVSGFDGNLERLEAVLEFGRAPVAGADELIAHEFLLYQWGARSDADVRAAVGKTVRVEFAGTDARRPEALLALFDADPTRLSEDELRAMMRARDLLPKAVEKLELPEADRDALLRALGRKKGKDPSDKVYAPVAAEFRLVGVFREPDRKAETELVSLFEEGLTGDVVLPRDRAERLLSGLPRRNDRGFDRATITVDSDEQLKPVCDRIKAEGYHYFAVGLFLQQARKNTILIGFTMDFVALLALTVACLGITNTMFTAVLERVKEIGVMKAVGAKDWHVLALFLIEGSLIGLVGGWLGVLVGWLVSFPGDNYALRLIREQEPNMPQPETVFRYPLWLVLGAPAFAVLMTTLAGLLPARRAARVEPVIALRAE